jgi:regulator of RNase E activity RraB
MTTRQNKLFYVLTIPFLIGCGQTTNYDAQNKSMDKTTNISSDNSRFVTEDSFKNNLQKQVDMTPQTLEQLRQAGVTADKELKLEFFFYTNSDDKAKKLADELAKLNYSVEHRLAADSKTEFVITGWTTKMKMSEDVVKKWTKEMCELSYKFDCDYDGWGTQPE